MVVVAAPTVSCALQVTAKPNASVDAAAAATSLTN
jgi:hypothetical protein